MAKIAKVHEVAIDKLVPYERNAKIHNAEQVEKIARSIEEFGFISPCIIDEAYNLIAGHGRVEAAKVAGLEKVPCVFVEGLTDTQRKAYILADNKLGELAEWDVGLVNAELMELLDDDFDIEITGFDIPEIEEDEPQIEEDEVPEPEADPITKSGDVWQLGKHRLMCGDSTSTEDVAKLMGGELADMVFTDPPYGMKKEKDGVENDNLNFDDLLEFNKKWISVSFDNLKDTGGWYCWGIDEPLMDIYAHILKPLKKENKIVVRNYITWAKHSAIGVNSDLMMQYPKETEKCWFVIKGMNWGNNNAEFFNTKFEKVLEYLRHEAQTVGLTPKKLNSLTGVSMYSHWFSKSQFTVIPEKHYKKLQNEYPDNFRKTHKELQQMLQASNDLTAELKPYFDNHAAEKVDGIGLTDVWRFTTTRGEEREDAGGHATPKPVALCCRGIKASSRPDEVVLDFFGGSGSTLIACEQIGRRARLMELEPKWCDVIIQRWENFTGEKAVLLNE